MSDYEKYLTLHSKKLSSGVFHDLVIGGLLAIEKFAKFQWSDLYKSAVSVSKKKVDFAIAEMEAPGRELSLVTKLNKKFDPNQE